MMQAVSYRRIATAIKMTSKGGGHFAHRCVDCRPGGRRGDTERIVAQWQSLVAFMKALDHLHQAMCAPRWPSKWPETEVHLFPAAA